MAGMSQQDRGAGSTVMKGKLNQSHYLGPKSLLSSDPLPPVDENA